MDDLGFVNGTVFGAWNAPAAADALIVSGGKVAWIGRRSEMPRVGRKVDLGGAVLGPGLTDAHVHLYAIAASRLNLDLGGPDVDAHDALLARLAQGAVTLPEGAWVMATGFDENRLRDPRYPTRAELDAAVPDRPVLVRRFCGHVALVNSAALRVLGLGDGTGDPEGGAFGRDPDGRLDGSASEAAAEAIFRAVPRPDAKLLARALRATIGDAAALGLTAAVEAAIGFTDGFPAEFALWQGLRRECADLPLRLGFMHRLDAPEAAAHGLRPTPDPDWQAITLKFFADGIVGARTAAMTEGYADGAGHGYFMRPEPALRRALAEAHEAGWQVAVHAVGDRAVALVAESLEAARRAHPRQPAAPHRIEHAFRVAPGLLPGLRDLGALVVTQPSFLSRMNRSIHAAFGEAAGTCYQARAMIEAGIGYVPSSDAPTGSISPWIGVADAMDRGASAGRPVGPDEALRAPEVLAAYAEGGARAMGHQGWRGRLEPGMAADLIAIDRDPTGAEAATMRGTQVLLTVVRGRVVHDRLHGGRLHDAAGPTERPAR
ncbi:amidohydrolase [Methylobacterium currus]|uniref:amidohydrolase n=1 Tax=Methylobacterium currus TaxID=2051553 RepID=UPI001FD5C94E|nr:amidohydrolase [Methylobacterium currus]